MNHNTKNSRYHLVIIILLLLSNALSFSIMVSQEKKNDRLEQQLEETYEYDQYSEDLAYCLR
jgi:hypothetical protein